MMDLTNINTGDGRVARGREVIAIEKNALLGLGPHMANCVEKLLCLALTQARVFAKEAQSGTFDNGKKSVVYEFSSVLLSALTHTRLESQVSTLPHSFSYTDFWISIIFLTKTFIIHSRLCREFVALM